MNNENKFAGGYDSKFQQLSIQILETEDRTRREWFKKHFKKIYASYLENEVPKSAEILLAKLNEQRNQVKTEDHKPEFGYKVEKENIDLPPPDADINLMTMRPVESEVRELLYHGLSHDHEGDYKYLKTRLKKSPKERYWFPETTQWTYGWLGDTNDDCLRDQKYGHKSIMDQSLFSRNGWLEKDEDIQPLPTILK